MPTLKSEKVQGKRLKSIFCYSYFTDSPRIFRFNKLETRFQRTESKDSNDIIFIAKTLRHCTFPLFKLQQP